MALGLFLLIAVSYGYFFGGGGWNQNAQFDLTRALVEKHSFRIDGFADNTGDVSRFGGHVYANKAPGISLLAAIPYFVIYHCELASGLDPSEPAVMGINLYALTFLVSGLGGALVGVLLFIYGRQNLFGRQLSLAVALIASFGTPLFGFSTLFFAHVPSAALLLLAYVLSLRRSLQSRAVAGFFSGIGGLSNYLVIPAAAVVCCGALLRDLRVMSRREAGRRWGIYLAGAMPSALLLFIYQQSAFGGAFRTPIDTMDGRFIEHGAFLGILAGPSMEAFLGITVSPYRGLFFLSPILFAAFVGATSMLLRREVLDVAIVASVSMIFFLFNISFNGWEGGFSIGPRYLLPAVPFAALFLFRGLTRGRALWWILGLLAVFLNFAAAAVDPQPSGTIPNPVAQYILPLLFRGEFPAATPITLPYSSQTIMGHVAVNPLTVDQIIPFSKHGPGSDPTMWASFNLGESIFGVGSALSLLPILVWILGGACFLWITARSFDRLRPHSGDGSQLRKLS
ncbi:MAG: hypothetical protein ABI718_01385 [Acidobacteriota bacterium]